MEKLSFQFVSVIVPVYNDAERLKLCLQALENQTYPPDLYEVIVVDNGSDESQNIKGVVDEFERAIATYESFPGSYAARNQGISLAKGDVIAFTDADCIPHFDWIEKGVKNLLDLPNCGLVAGKINIFCKNPDRITPIELYESITAFPQQKLLEQHKGGATANVFTFRRVIERVGVFDPNLKSNGDLEWGKRVYLAGYQQIYADDACVDHPARSSFEQIYQRTIRLAGGLYDLKIKKESSSLKRNAIFIKLFSQNFIPPLNFVVCTFLDSRLKNMEKIKVALVMFLVRYVTGWELIRIKLGRASARI